MTCRYFNEDYAGFCGATASLHIPSISDMEQLCFKNFQSCPIYNEFEEDHRPVAGKICNQALFQS